MGFGPDLNATLRIGAEYVEGCSAGAKARRCLSSSLPSFELMINLKTRKRWASRSHSRSWLRADEVIQ